MQLRGKTVICARNSEALSYRGIHPNLDIALEHITKDFLSSLDTEPIYLKGDAVYCTKFTYLTLKDEESFFEAHECYLDVHIMLEGSERIEIASPSHLEVKEAEPDNDFWAYTGKADYSLALTPGNFLVVFPDDAHKLKMQVDQVRTVTKAVFKVRLDEYSKVEKGASV